jgi:hypothetical protein
LGGKFVNLKLPILIQNLSIEGRVTAAEEEKRKTTTTHIPTR